MSAKNVPLLHFDMRAGSYWLPLPSGEYIPLDTGQAKLHLRAAGLDPDAWVKGLNEVEIALYTAQRERHCHYAGPLAGWQPGAFATGDGRKCLVTSGPRIPNAKAGKWPFIERFVGELLGGEQGLHFGLWLARAREALAARSFRPGQLVALAGPSGCGKSLLQSIVTESFGGRCASPYLYMVGETTFNADLAQAEHWSIEDRASSTDIRTRRKFGASLKEAVVNRDLQVHAKGRQAIVLPTFRRVTLSTNDEPENLMILPPLDESIVDKVNLYHCGVAAVGDDRARTWGTIQKELPAFLHECASLKTPAKWKDDRYGLRAYQHATLAETITAAAPETRLLTLIDEAVFGGKDESPWQGSAAQLEKVLLTSEFGHAVGKLLYYSTAASVYLQRLAVRYPARVSSKRNAGKTTWTLCAP
jgi:hypothetical protein